jgi:SAM-dependent methyltransferase
MSKVSRLRTLAQALRSPALPPTDPGWLRTLVARRGVFDLVSTVMQLRDVGFLESIQDGEHRADGHYNQVHAYNAGVTSTKIITRTRRAESLIAVLAMPPRDLSRERVLLVGPRTRHEMLQVWLAGFDWNKIEGIDLYSANPKIKVMNMERMSFPDGTFDALLSSATLTYAKDLSGCVREFLRVLRAGGRAAFGHAHIPGAEFAGNAISGQELERYITEAGGLIYYRNIVEKTAASGLPARIHEFGVIKHSDL